MKFNREKEREEELKKKIKITVKEPRNK